MRRSDPIDSHGTKSQAETVAEMTMQIRKDITRNFNDFRDKPVNTSKTLDAIKHSLMGMFGSLNQTPQIVINRPDPESHMVHVDIAYTPQMPVEFDFIWRDPDAT